MHVLPRSRRGVTALLLAVLVLGAACGDSADPGELVPQATTADLEGDPPAPAVTQAGPTDAGSAETTVAAEAPPAPAEAPDSDLPAVTVVDLAGGDFYLPSLVPADRPILLWFWAPH